MAADAEDNVSASTLRQQLSHLSKHALTEILVALSTFCRQQQRAQTPNASAYKQVERELEEQVRSYLVSTTTDETVHWWNRKYQQAMQSMQWESLRDVCSEFQELAETYARTLILEKDLPPHRKSYLPIEVGGIAGGDKYLIQGILFKFNNDQRNIYGGDEYAQKVSGHELKSMVAMMEAIKRTLTAEEASMLRFPLMCVCDWRGHRVMAMSLLPIQGSSTLVHGSCDVNVIHTDDPQCEGLLDSVMRHLNLKKHRVGQSGTQISTPIDLEVHRGPDCKYYCLDFARLFPPTPPNGQRGSHLYRLLRSEFVQKWPTPISSDAFSLFTTARDREGDSQEARHASDHLALHVVPKYAEYFDSCVEKIARHNDPSQTKPAQHAAAGELEPYLSLDDAVNLLSNLAESLHRSGINIRMLGLVRWHCKLAISKSLLLAEIVARAARKEVRHMLRTASKASSVPTFTALNRAATDYLNRLFGSSCLCLCSEQSPACLAQVCSSEVYWTHHLPHRLTAQFPSSIGDNELQDGGLSLRNVSLGGGTYLRVVFRRLAALGAFQIREATAQELGSSATAFERECVFAPADITGFRSVTKMPPVATIAEGMVMLQHAAETTDALERKRMLQLAVESFEQAVAMCPASPECLVRLSDGLYQLALPAARDQAMHLMKASLDRAETCLQVVAQRTITKAKEMVLTDPFAAAIHEDSRLIDSRAAHKARNTQSTTQQTSILRLASRKLIHAHESYGDYYSGASAGPQVEEVLEGTPAIKPVEPPPEPRYHSLIDYVQYDKLRPEDLGELTRQYVDTNYDDAFESVVSDKPLLAPRAALLVHARSYRSFKQGPTALTESVVQHIAPHDAHARGGVWRPWYHANELLFDMYAFRESNPPPQARAWCALALTLTARTLTYAVEKAPSEPRRVAKPKHMNDFQTHLAAIVGVDRALTIEDELHATKLALQLSLSACCVVGLLPDEALHDLSLADEDYDVAICTSLEELFGDSTRVAARIQEAMTCFIGADAWHDLGSLLLCTATAFYHRGVRQFGERRITYLLKARLLLQELVRFVSSATASSADHCKNASCHNKRLTRRGEVVVQRAQARKLLDQIACSMALLEVPAMTTLRATKLHSHEPSAVQFLKIRADHLHLFAVTSAFDGFLRVHRCTYQGLDSSGFVHEDDDGAEEQPTSPTSANASDEFQPTKPRWKSVFGRHSLTTRSSPQSVSRTRSFNVDAGGTPRLSEGYRMRQLVDGEIAPTSSEWDAPLLKLGNDESLEVQVHEDRIFCMSIRPPTDELLDHEAVRVDGETRPPLIVFTGSKDKSIRVVDLWTGRILKTLMAQEAVECLNSSPTLVATGHSQGMVLLWSAADATLGSPVSVLRGHNHAVRCVVVKQRCVVSGGVDRTIRVWSVDTFAPVAVLRGIGANNFGIILDMHGTMDEFMVASADRKIRLWNLHAGEELLQLRNSNHEDVLSVTLIPKFKCAITGHEDGYITLWDVQTGRMLDRIRPFGGAVNHIEHAVLPGEENMSTVILVCTSRDGHVKQFAFRYTAPTLSAADCRDSL